MPNLRNQLDLDRCPHCGVDHPLLHVQHNQETNNFAGTNRRFWRLYACTRCGGLIVAAATAGWDQPVTECYPKAESVDEAIPEKARGLLQQALESIHTPAGAVMLAASAVDAMLKAKGFREGSLYARIDKAAADHAITKDMAQWAHDVRLDANDQRHADEHAPLPSVEDAKRCVDFATALGNFMFVLPARVQRGIKEATQSGP
jgi:hypothetical protein